MTPDICPNCGAEVPANARTCPECGSCEETGWSEQAGYDSLDLPDEEFDYDDFVRREFGGGGRRRGRPWWLGAVAIGLVLAFLYWALR